MIRHSLLITGFAGVLLLTSGCAWVDAAGKAYEGAGEGLEDASNEAEEGSISQRVFEVGGVITKTVGQALQKGADSEAEIKTAKTSDQNSDVDTKLLRNIQGRLHELELLDAEPDGIFGDQTVSAIKQYQKDNALHVDGKVSKALWDHMK